MRTTLAIGLIIAGSLTSALAQPVTNGPVGRVATQPAQSSPLFQVGEDGTPIELEGSADLVALSKNELISDEDRQRIQPQVKEWEDRLERLVVENIDLAVALDTKALRTFDMKDTDNLMFVNDAVKMLSSAGTLTSYLSSKSVLTDEQVSENSRMVNDFQRQQMMYIGESAQKQMEGDVNAQIARVTEYNYREALRDPFWVYHRIVNSLAANPDGVAATLGGDAAPVADDLAKLRQTEGEAAVEHVRAILSKLDYEHQKALAAKGVELDHAASGG